MALLMLLLAFLALLISIWLYLLMPFILTPSVSRVLEEGPSSRVIIVRGILTRTNNRPLALENEPYAYALADRRDRRKAIPFTSEVKLDKHLGDEVVVKLKRVQDHFVFEDFVRQPDIIKLILLAIGSALIVKVLLYIKGKARKMISEAS